MQITTRVENEIEAGYTGIYQMVVSFDNPIMGIEQFRAINVSTSSSDDGRFAFLHGVSVVVVVDCEKATAAYVRFPEDLTSGALASVAADEVLVVEEVNSEGKDLRVHLCVRSIAGSGPDIFETVRLDPPDRRLKPGWPPRFDFN